MKVCNKCDKPIDEEGEIPYVMLIIKKKGKIMEFVCFHLSCWEGNFESPFVEKVKEKMNSCKSCRKPIRFWDSYIQGEGYLCKTCWDKKEKELEESMQESEKEKMHESRKADDSVDDTQKTL